MYVLRRDPLTHGRAVLERRCLGCHFDDGKGTGKQTASDLEGFGSRAWIRGLLEDPKSPAYFGKVPQCDGMVEWKKSTKLKGKQLDDVADFVASFARIDADQTPEEWLNSPEVADHPGSAPFEKECGTCHVVDGLTEGGLRDAPKLFAWGSPQWIARMIRKPNAADLYGFLEKDQKCPPSAPTSFARTTSDGDPLPSRRLHSKPRASPVAEKSPPGQPVSSGEIAMRIPDRLRRPRDSGDLTATALPARTAPPSAGARSASTLQALPHLAWSMSADDYLSSRSVESKEGEKTGNFRRIFLESAQADR